MNKSYTKAERTRNFIIESTAVIFNKKGYAGTSLTDLTNATGLTKGSIYGNFENKEEVAVAVFDYNCSRIARLTSQEVNQATTCYDKLMAYVRVYQTIIKETMNRGGCPVLNTATEADDTNGLLRKRAANAVLTWEGDLTTIIKKGILNGEFKTNTDPRKTALSIIALIEGGIMISKVTGDATAMDHILSTVETLIDQIER
ncbi:TetR/AcrR family transcriptional regulator [Pedobacter cryoconitis]|uniref:TetR/AcrR family transcriptional regulator n=1 Tax=Pedobacter cryoconitis TaxID=188932 RepID=UPI0016169D65|nr:TetR/AcrR family transcriptional regulator [Pedobacter cryoconitis]MBB5644084.1 AcrR family transcriptional regulator [Pedobacter cryoconitis]